MRTSGICATIALGLGGVWLSGCFTEVGNADDERLAKAEFRIDYTAQGSGLPKRQATLTDSVIILQFNPLVEEAVYHYTDVDTKLFVESYLWQDEDGGIPIDFTGKDTSAKLPVQNLNRNYPEDLQMELHLPHADSALVLDTIDFDAFKNTAYIKGTYRAGGAVARFLFALPPVHEIRLFYPRAILDSWLDGKVYRCQFIFFATRWMSGLDRSQPVSMKDARGRDMIVFDSTHNTSIYQTLVDQFYRSFNTSNVTIDSGM